MATVTLRFTALPEHVRTARLVATAVARRMGMDEEVLDGVRIGVGEACSLAVQRNRLAGRGELVELRLDDADERLVVTVVDSSPAEQAHVEDADLAMTLVEGLADEVAEVRTADGTGTRLEMVWGA